MKKVLDMMNEFCYVLTQMERAGIYIDRTALKKLEEEFSIEKKQLEARLTELAQEVAGDKPLNLSSSDDLSALLYSRVPYSKKVWKKEFELGGGNKPRSMSPNELNAKILRLSYEEYRTEGKQCPDCKGYGKVSRKRKNGGWTKPIYKCLVCGTTGIKYKLLPEVSGFRQKIAGVDDLTAHGFTTNKDKLEYLERKASGKAKEFLKGMVRYNAISSYLSTYINGIWKNVQSTGFLHPEFMQCVTKTGRLSSRSPNFQNQPRGGTFPIRRVVVSRWEGGCITEGDYGQLEFRVAAELSGCKVALHDIKCGVDVHQYTADTITAAGQVTSRQDAKAHTFKPLYGGMSGTPAEVSYYKSFIDKYRGIKAWHETICDRAVATQRLVLPTGRTYKFPEATRTKYGYVTGSTKIKNYPVQGFATADIVPCATIDVYNEMKRRDVKSVLINEVHDSIVVDTCPGEEKIIVDILAQSMLQVPDTMKRRFNYSLKVPMAVEIKQGINWLDMGVVYEGSNDITLEETINE